MTTKLCMFSLVIDHLKQCLLRQDTNYVIMCKGERNMNLNEEILRKGVRVCLNFGYVDIVNIKSYY